MATRYTSDCTPITSSTATSSSAVTATGPITGSSATSADTTDSTIDNPSSASSSARLSTISLPARLRIAANAAPKGTRTPCHSRDCASATAPCAMGIST